jgi:hypothetical protein
MSRKCSSEGYVVVTSNYFVAYYDDPEDGRERRRTAVCGVVIGTEL